MLSHHKLVGRRLVCGVVLRCYIARYLTQAGKSEYWQSVGCWRLACYCQFMKRQLITTAGQRWYKTDSYLERHHTHNSIGNRKQQNFSCWIYVVPCGKQNLNLPHWNINHKVRNCSGTTIVYFIGITDSKLCRIMYTYSTKYIIY